MSSEKLIFISHRTSDKEVADMLLDFLATTGIPRASIKCSSLPGNDVREKISPEVRIWIDNSVVNIAILSRDYYKSSYCLNEAGILWYLKDTPVIPIALPEIEPSDMVGFLNSDYKIRRLSSDTDIAEIYDMVQERTGAEPAKHTVVAVETSKLKNRYKTYCDGRQILFIEDKDSEADTDKDVVWIDQEDIWGDGYHELHDNEDKIIEKGQYQRGTLVDGISYDIILKVSKDRVGVEDREPTEEEAENFDGYDYDAWKEKLLEEPVSEERIKEESWKYCELHRFEYPLMLSSACDYIKRLGIEYFYVVDKKVRLEGKEIKPTFTNFRTLESYMASHDPDGLEYLKTGKWGFEEADSAEIED